MEIEFWSFDGVLTSASSLEESQRTVDMYDCVYNVKSEASVTGKVSNCKKTWAGANLEVESS